MEIAHEINRNISMLLKVPLKVVEHGEATTDTTVDDVLNQNKGPVIVFAIRRPG